MKLTKHQACFLRGCCIHTFFVLGFGGLLLAFGSVGAIELETISVGQGIRQIALGFGAVGFSAVMLKIFNVE